ncbi:MAG: serine/threonine protein kinase [Planctomyces sp.]|nr:serine/threonine protein kinase [Planctomyces sp.]
MRILLLTLASALIASSAFAETPRVYDWPQWQGANRDAMSLESGLLTEWPEGGPQLAWRREGLGGGYSAPAITRGHLFGMSNQGNDEVVWALSEEDGSEVWSTVIGPANKEGMHQGIEGPGCTPTVEGDRMYVIGASGTLACLKVANGDIIWTSHLVTDLGGEMPTWRFNESPLIDGDQLICTPGGDENTIVALNKNNGEMIWHCAVPAAVELTEEQKERLKRPNFANSKAGYASAIAIDFEGVHQIVQLTAKALVGINAEDGTLLWRYDAPASQTGINCSTPLFQDDLVFASSAYGNGGGAVRLSKTEDGGIAAEEVYFTKDMQNHHGGMIVINDALYGANGGNGGGFMSCLDFKTGDILWRDRDAPKGSLVAAGGMLYLFSEDGEAVLFEPNSKQYVEKGRFKIPTRSEAPAWAHPVVANGKLYLRDQGNLYCYDVRAQAR